MSAIPLLNLSWDTGEIREMNAKPLVSIVIPVYNGSDYMAEAIDSALAQTYPNVEVIVVNDGSTDDGKTDAIARSYSNRIRYFLKANGGVATALNLGIQEMHGEWFAWLSHDDRFAENRIEADLALLQTIPNAKVSFCRHMAIDSVGKIIGDKTYPLPKVTNPREALIFGCVHMCTVTIHKSCFEAVGLFNQANRTNQDVEMSLRLAKQYIFFFNPNTVTYQREHLARGTHTLPKKLHQQDRLMLCEFVHNELTLTDFFPNLGADKTSLSEAWTWLGNFYARFGAETYAAECFYNAAVVGESNYLYRWKKRVLLWALRTNNSSLYHTITTLSGVKRRFHELYLVNKTS